MMLLLGHPGLGAQNADIYNVNGLDIEKPTLPKASARPVGVRSRGAWKSSNVGPFFGTLVRSLFGEKMVGVLGPSFGVGNPPPKMGSCSAPLV